MSGLGLNELKPGAVAIAQDGKIAIVVGHALSRPKNPLLIKTKAGGTEYIAPLSSFKAVIGHVDLAAFEAAGIVKPPMWEPRSQIPVNGFDIMPDRVKALNLKVGDLIRYKHGRSVVTATFNGFNWGRRTCPVSYSINGKACKGKVEDIVGKAMFGRGAVDAEQAEDAVNEAEARYS